MTARLYEVVGLQRDADSSEVTDVWADFALRPVEHQAPLELLNRPTMTPYSLDLANDAVIFVEGATAQELAVAPFAYMAQRRRAARVLKVDVATFLTAFGGDEPGPRLLQLYSVGRCGSTLLHHVLNRVDGVLSLAEPDVLFQLALWRKSGRLEPALATQIARATFACLWRRRPPGCEVLAVKHRGKGIWAFREFHAAAPGARALFLYRNALDTIQSFDRLSGYRHGRTQWRYALPLVAALSRRFMRDAAARAGVAVYREHLYETRPEEVVGRCGYAGHYLLDWLSKVDCYLRLREVDPSVRALRYEDLVAEPATVVPLLLTENALPAGNLERLLEVFAMDAQAGTPLARRAVTHHALNARTVREITKVLAREAQLPAGGLLPGTLTVSARAAS